MSHMVDPGFGGERALGDKCALPSSLYTGVRYKPLLTGGMALLAGGAMPLAFAPLGLGMACGDRSGNIFCPDRAVFKASGAVVGLPLWPRLLRRGCLLGLYQP